jgi:hypothetical protein
MFRFEWMTGDEDRTVLRVRDDDSGAGMYIRNGWMVESVSHRNVAAALNPLSRMRARNIPQSC